MPRPRKPGAKDRSRPQVSEAPSFIRRPTLARLTDTTEGWWRQLEARGTGPRVIRVGRVALYDRDEAFTWLRRNAQTPAA